MYIEFKTIYTKSNLQRNAKRKVMK